MGLSRDTYKDPDGSTKRYIQRSLTIRDKSSSLYIFIHENVLIITLAFTSLYITVSIHETTFAYRYNPDYISMVKYKCIDCYRNLYIHIFVSTDISSSHSYINGC